MNPNTVREMLNLFTRDDLRSLAKFHRIKIGQNKRDTVENLVSARAYFSVSYDRAKLIIRVPK